MRHVQLLILVTLLSGGCHFDALYSHYCPITDESGNWDQFQLNLEHTEPRLCPVQLAYPGEGVSVAGIIHDYSKQWRSAKMYVFQPSLTPLRESLHYFVAGPEPDYNVAYVSETYPAGTERGAECEDFGHYQMWEYAEGVYAGNPWAWLYLTYTYQGGIYNCPA